MIAETSIEAYKKILDYIKSKRQRAVYEVLYHNPGMSNRQIKDVLGWEINCVTGRVTELREKRVLRWFGELKPCATTGNIVRHWYPNPVFKIPIKSIRCSVKKSRGTASRQNDSSVLAQSTDPAKIKVQKELFGVAA